MIKRTYTKRKASAVIEDDSFKRRKVESHALDPSSSSPSPRIFSDGSLPKDDDWTPPSSPNRPGTKEPISRFAGKGLEEIRREAAKPRSGLQANDSASNVMKMPEWAKTNSKTQKIPIASLALSRPKKTSSKPMTQMRLDLGQTIHKRCGTCGMEYRPSVQEDKKLHDKYHNSNLQGITIPAKLNETLRVLEGEEKVWSEDVIIPVETDRCKRHKPTRKLVLTALEVVEKELGGVGIREEELFSTVKQEYEDGNTNEHGRYTTFLYARKHKVIGVCLAERISEAYPVLPSPSDACIEAATTPQAARLGISRIWVSQHARGQGIATKLLRFAATRFLWRQTVEKDKIAFSQPTSSGAKLAKKFFGKDVGWLVYIG